MKLVCKTQFGSHLYGTATPTSDIDVRGVFIPSKRDILLGRIPKTNREQEAGKEEDYELYSIHQFVKLACEGQTLAFDMLWAPASMTVRGEAAHVWDDLVSKRHLFISKRMNAFIGYARGQAAKYSLKGERLAKLEAFLGVLKSAQGEPGLELWNIWDKLPKDDERVNPQAIHELQIAGKWFGATTRINLVRTSIEGTIAAYGQRANASKEGVDWKAMSHAVRVSLELHELLNTHEIKFPLTYADGLLRIKQGLVPLETVHDYIDECLRSIEEIMSKSHLPETVDTKYWDEWLLKTVEENI